LQSEVQSEVQSEGQGEVQGEGAVRTLRSPGVGVAVDLGSEVG